MLFFIGLISGVVMALFWDKTYTIFGKERSVVFLSCVFCLAILDCTCTIAFLTYIGSFKGNYVTALYIGEGISSLLPSLFALAQGTGDDQGDSSCYSTLSSNYSLNATANRAESLAQPRFSVSVYFWLLFGILVVSFCAFLVLDFWPSFQKEKKNYKKQTKNKIVKDKKDVMIILNREVSENLLHEKRNNEDDDDDDEFYLEPTTNESNLQKRGSKVSMKRRQSFDKFFLLVLITLVSFFIYGFLPGLSSYSAMPYGSNIMHFCSTLSNIFNINQIFLFIFGLFIYFFIFKA